MYTNRHVAPLLAPENNQVRPSLISYLSKLTNKIEYIPSMKSVNSKRECENQKYMTRLRSRDIEIY